MCHKLLIFQKSYDLLLWLFPVINRIPKSHRQVLGKILEERGLSLLLLIIKANQSQGVLRSNLQLAISTDLDSLRILLRLTKDLKFMSIKQYTMGIEKINEIARMLNSWMKVV